MSKLDECAFKKNNNKKKKPQYNVDVRLYAEVTQNRHLRAFIINWSICAGMHKIEVEPVNGTCRWLIPGLRKPTGPGVESHGHAYYNEAGNSYSVQVACRRYYAPILTT